MHYSLIVLESAETDLKEIKHYVNQRFSAGIWKKTSNQLKTALKQIQRFPYSGSIPIEVIELQLNQYQQIICDMNRIIYEIDDNKILIHMIVDVRRDMKSLLMKRLMKKID
ncbi:MAG: type II toxin-antitoxin system RelE/ParE family toxin [Cellvibrio sp.]|nr:type II toxin-antitoxin system RelE/ParE family toxin [Cellvibrio sp.]